MNPRINKDTHEKLQKNRSCDHVTNYDQTIDICITTLVCKTTTKTTADKVRLSNGAKTKPRLRPRKSFSCGIITVQEHQFKAVIDSGDGDVSLQLHPRLQLRVRLDKSRNSASTAQASTTVRQNNTPPRDHTNPLPHLFIPPSHDPILFSFFFSPLCHS